MPRGNGDRDGFQDLEITILGDWCDNCIKLDVRLRAVLNNMTAGYVPIRSVRDRAQSERYLPLADVPGLLINGRLASTRIVPDRPTLRRWLADQIER